MSNFVIIKAGTTFPNTAREYGDFEDWTCKGLGLTLNQVCLIDAMQDDLPSAKTCSGVVVTGSHSMVTDRHDWSRRLEGWIAELVDKHIPFLGICYGHQLLAQATCGMVDYHPSGQEIGTVDIKLLPESTDDPIFHGLPISFPVHVTHSQTVISLPQNAVQLAANSFEKNHAIRVGNCAWGVQFHPEYDFNIMNSYITEQLKELKTAKRDIQAIYKTVKETKDAATILKRFAEISN